STLKVDAWHTFEESSGNRVEVLLARRVTVLLIEDAGLLCRPGQVRNLVRRVLDRTSCRCRLTRDADVLRAIVRPGLKAVRGDVVPLIPGAPYVGLAIRRPWRVPGCRRCRL